MKIEVLGPGCPKCSTLEATVKKALTELNISAEVVKITDINTMIEKSIMQTPGLIIDGKLVLQGKVPNLEQIKQIIQKGVSG